jgi:hypothetical protein
MDDFLILQKFILDKQKNGKLFFIGRLSGNETRFTGDLITSNTVSPDLFRNMLYGAGISFNDTADVELYIHSYDNAVSKCDMLGVWTGNMRMQAANYYNHIASEHSHIPQIAAQALEPYYYMDSSNYQFSKIFENKRVLIITSHYETTRSQLEKRTALFHKPIFADNTEFYVYKAPQQNGGSHDGQSWTEHAEKMKRSLRNIKDNRFDFDIVLVSCGGFGMIISEFIFSELKSSVMYVGGALQIYFGIMGQRWTSNERIMKHMNSEWVRPLDVDKPKLPNLCENNCYW